MLMDQRLTFWEDNLVPRAQTLASACATALCRCEAHAHTPLSPGLCNCFLCSSQKWINSVGKAQKRKGKRLFMPMRIALTGRMEGSDLGDQLAMLMLEQGDVVDPAAVQFVTLGQRLESLREWSAQQPAFVAPVAV